MQMALTGNSLWCEADAGVMTGPSLSREEREGAALSSRFLPHGFPAPLLHIIWGMKRPQDPRLLFHRPGEVQGGHPETERWAKPDPTLTSSAARSGRGEGGKQAELGPNRGLSQAFLCKMEITL